MTVKPHPLNDLWVNLILEQAEEGIRDGHITIVAKDPNNPRAVRCAEIMTEAVRAALKDEP